jgi:hypothetical protein
MFLKLLLESAGKTVILSSRAAEADEAMVKGVLVDGRLTVDPCTVLFALAALSAPFLSARAAAASLPLCPAWLQQPPLPFPFPFPFPSAALGTHRPRVTHGEYVVSA